MVSLHDEKIFGCARRRAAQFSPALGAARARGIRCEREYAAAEAAATGVLRIRFQYEFGGLSRPPPRPETWRHPLTPRSRYAERGAELWSAPSRASWRLQTRWIAGEGDS